MRSNTMSLVRLPCKKKMDYAPKMTDRALNLMDFALKMPGFVPTNDEFCSELRGYGGEVFRRAERKGVFWSVRTHAIAS